jgi:hypothetical protein
MPAFHVEQTDGTMIISHDVGRSISAKHHRHGDPHWTLTYGDTLKPHFSSLRTPSGHELALVEPVDHLWHRGLWFAIKFVNGVNFWEERDEFGRQETIGIPEIGHYGDAVTITAELDWIGPGDDIPVRERRTITFRPGEGYYTLDWRSEVTARADIELDRTPYTTWGGYGGLSFRGNRTWHIDRYLYPGGSEKPLTPGVRAPWVDLSGSFDGGPDLTGGIAVFDLNDSDPGPTPWYGGGDSSMNFVNAAFLFEGPRSLANGATLDLNYRVVVHDGIWTEDDATAHLDAEPAFTARTGS